MTILEKAKQALRITEPDFDEEIQDLIDAAYADLDLVGVGTINEEDPLIRRAVLTYCKLHFGTPEEFDRLERSYNAQKGQLMTATGYTDWEDTDGQIQNTDPCGGNIQP